MTTGIYYLYNKNILVYIGQAICCEKRLSQHLGNKDFDEYEIIEVEKKKLNEVEATEILKYKPKYNKSIPKNKIFISLSQFLKEKEGNKMFNIEKKLAKVISLKIKPLIFRGTFYFKRKELESNLHQIINTDNKHRY